LFGVMEHALVNYDAGPLDQRFAEAWDALSPWLRWWYAITRTVGPAPTLAPGMLGQAATTLILATIGQRATFPESATRHRRHPYLSRLPPTRPALASTALLLPPLSPLPDNWAATHRPDTAAHAGDAVDHKRSPALV
jgi:hypothetical protein